MQDQPKGEVLAALAIWVFCSVVVYAGLSWLLYAMDLRNF